MSKIITFEDKKNFDFYFKKYWNSFVKSDTSKISFKIEDFLEKMKDDDYLRAAINKMEYQDRLISCQYIKLSDKEQGFANFFLMRLPFDEKIHSDSQYYFIFKNQLSTIENVEDYIFYPKRKIYKKLKINPDSLDYLANFSIPLCKNDFIYCLSCEELYRPDEVFDSSVIEYNFANKKCSFSFDIDDDLDLIEDDFEDDLDLIGGDFEDELDLIGNDFDDDLDYFDLEVEEFDIFDFDNDLDCIDFEVEEFDILDLEDDIDFLETSFDEELDLIDLEDIEI